MKADEAPEVQVTPKASDISDRQTGDQNYSVLRSLRKEFTCRRLSLYHIVPEEFYLAECQNDLMVHPCFLIYRSALAVAFIVIFINELCGAHPSTVSNLGPKWFIKFYHWKTIGTTFLYIFSAAICIQKYIEQKKMKYSVQKYLYGIYWVCEVAIIDLTMAAVLIRIAQHTQSNQIVDIHLVTSYLLTPILIAVDMLVVAHPIRLLHVYCPLALVIIYEIFAYVYCAAGYTNERGENRINHFFDWLNNPLNSFTYLLGLMLTISIAHFLMFSLFCIRRAISVKFGSNGEDENTSESL